MARRQRLWVSFHCDEVHPGVLVRLAQHVAADGQEVCPQHIGEGVWLGFGWAEERYPAAFVVREGAVEVFGQREYRIPVPGLRVQAAAMMPFRVDKVCHHPTERRRLVTYIDDTTGCWDYLVVEQAGKEWEEIGRVCIEQKVPAAFYLADGRIFGHRSSHRTVLTTSIRLDRLKQWVFPETSDIISNPSKDQLSKTPSGRRVVELIFVRAKGQGRKRTFVRGTRYATDAGPSPGGD